MLHSFGSLQGSVAPRWTLYVQHRSLMRNHRTHLLALNAANFTMIRRDAEHWDPVRRAQFGDVICFSIEGDPSNSRSCRGSRHLRQRGRTSRLEDNGIRSRR
jgi:hypothetical protein